MPDVHLSLILGPDIHANRPSAAAVSKGALYSCTTHGLVYRSDGASWSTWATVPGTSGTVTSVAQSVPAEFSVAGSPITTSGTLAISKANQSANQVWAGPTSGGAAAPGFRALVAADLPSTRKSITVTSATSLDSTHFIVYGDASGGDFTITLPSAAGSSGRVYIIKNAGNSGGVDVACDGSDKFDAGNSTVTLRNYTSSGESNAITIQSDGSANWFVLSVYKNNI